VLARTRGPAGSLALIQCELRAGLPDLQNVSRHLALLVVERELEAVGQQLLDHDSYLLRVGNALGVGQGFNVIAVAADPRRAIHDLFDLHV